MSLFVEPRADDVIVGRTPDGLLTGFCVRVFDGLGVELREVGSMSKYMIKASYSPEGIKGVMAKGGTARVDAIGKLAAGVGGSLESCYFAFGSDDLYAIVDAPNPEAMAAIAGTVTATGVLSSYETVVLLTAAQMDDASRMSVDYSPPGS